MLQPSRVRRWLPILYSSCMECHLTATTVVDRRAGEKPGGEASEKTAEHHRPRGSEAYGGDSIVGVE
jgi:hypothetical protein